jgi:hypothetical protein
MGFEFIPKSREYLLGFVKEKLGDYYEIMREYHPRNGYGPLKHGDKFVTYIRDMVHGLEESFGELSIPGAYQSPDDLIKFAEDWVEFIGQRSHLFELHKADRGEFSNWNGVVQKTFEIKEQITRALNQFVHLAKIELNDSGLNFNVDSFKIIITVLGNFANAIKPLTQNRRKGKNKFEIVDEYDVQDVLKYFFLSIFPDIKIEEPNPSVGGSYTKCEFFHKSSGIMTEVKMLKNGEDEKKYIQEVKIDLESYYTNENLKALIVFFYDPFNQIKNRAHIKELEGVRVKGERRFSVHTIIQ